MRFFESAGRAGYTIQSETVQIRLDESDAKELIETVLAYMMLDASALTADNAAWLAAREGGRS